MKMSAGVRKSEGITVWKLKMVVSVGDQRRALSKTLRGGGSDVKLHWASGPWKKASDMTENKPKKSNYMGHQQ